MLIVSPFLASHSIVIVDPSVALADSLLPFRLVSNVPASNSSAFSIISWSMEPVPFERVISPFSNFAFPRYVIS